jgi:hypothetical protein
MGTDQTGCGKARLLNGKELLPEEKGGKYLMDQEPKQKLGGRFPALPSVKAPTVCSNTR